MGSANEIHNARLQLHHAVQLNTRLARGFIPARDDDGHTSLVWLPVAGGALAGQWVGSSPDRFRLVVGMPGLTLLLLDEGGAALGEFPLDGRTFPEARQWLEERMAARGLDPAPLAVPPHFQLDDHPLAHGAKFSLAGAGGGFPALAGYFATAAALLEEYRAADPRASAVLCWPHHFDIATLLTVSAPGEPVRTIGAGLSPGDGSYDEPYYYVSPRPQPDPATLPPLAPGAFWHTEGWAGAVLLPRDLPAERIRAYLREAIGLLDAL